MTWNGDRLAAFGIFADSGTEYDGSGKGNAPSAGVNHGAAGKIVETEFREPASTPGPVTLDGIDQDRNND